MAKSDSAPLDSCLRRWLEAVESKKFSYARSHHASRRTQVEHELEEVQRRLDRLIDALADGSLPADEIKRRLGAEKARKTTLQAELRPYQKDG